MTNWLDELEKLMDEHRKDHPGMNILQRRMAVRDVIVHRMMKELGVSKLESQNKLNALIWDADKRVYRTYTRRRSE